MAAHVFSLDHATVLQAGLEAAVEKVYMLHCSRPLSVCRGVQHYVHHSSAVCQPPVLINMKSLNLIYLFTSIHFLQLYATHSVQMVAHVLPLDCATVLQAGLEIIVQEV